MKLRKETVFIAILALVALLSRSLLVDFISDEDLGRKLIVFMHLLFVLLAVAKGTYDNKHLDTGPSIKMGVQMAGKYALIVGLYLYVYYNWINTAYFPQRIAELVSKTTTNTPEELQRVTEAYTSFFTPGLYASLSVMSFLLMGTMYAILCTLLFRKL